MVLSYSIDQPLATGRMAVHSRIWQTQIRPRRRRNVHLPRRPFRPIQTRTFSRTSPRRILPRRRMDRPLARQTSYL